MILTPNVERAVTATISSRPRAAQWTPTWRDWRVGLGAAIVTAGAYGLLAGRWTPRGPITATETLTAMGISLVVGGFAGAATRSRWAMLLAPATFVAVFELTRLGSIGPTVDGVHLDSTYGLLAFASGRGVHALVALFPMALGAAVGASLSKSHSAANQDHGLKAKIGVWTGRTLTALAALALVTLAVAIGRPARTAPIPGPNGAPLAGSVAELDRVRIGEHDLSMMIRGYDARKPVLLFLAGGPGGSELGAMRRHGQALEKDFVVVTFDQRGSGRSYDTLDPASTVTLDGSVSDVLGVTNYLRRRFDQDKIYVVGNSWGSILGVLAVQRRPELFHAFVGVGQMVSPRETDRIFYQDTLAWARRRGDVRLAEKLEASGPPPYVDILDYEAALTHEQQIHPYDHSRNAEGAGGFSENLLVEEYSLMDKLHTFGAFLDVLAILYPQLQDIDFRDDVPELKAPVYLVQGRHEAPGRALLAEAWFRKLDAPSKTLIVLDTSGHRPLFEQPERFAEVMTGIVLRATRDPTRGRRIAAHHFEAGGGSGGVR